MSPYDDGWLSGLEISCVPACWYGKHVPMSNLEKHAEFELRRAGLFDKDSDYGGMLGEAVMKLVRVFAADGHSGYSAQMTLGVFQKVASFKTLTAITSDPEEWMQVSPDIMPNGDPPVWQNRRQSSCFSNDGGKTHYDIDAGDDRAIRQTKVHEVPALQVSESLKVTPRPS